MKLEVTMANGFGQCDDGECTNEFAYNVIDPTNELNVCGKHMRGRVASFIAQNIKHGDIFEVTKV